MEEQKKVEVTSSDSEVIEQGKIYAFLGYFGILFLVPILAKKDNTFAVFHGKQGLVLFVVEIIVWLLGFIPFLGWYIIWPIGFIFCLIMAIAGMIQALSGKYWKMPLIGDYAEKITI